MTCNLTTRLYSIIPCFRRTLRQNQCLNSFKKSVISREYSSTFPSKYHEDKYGELRNRLASVPYLNLLNKEVDSIHHELSYEKDKRLEDVLKWCSKVFNYNARNGKKIRAVALLKAYCTYGFSIDDATWKQWDSDSWRSAVILAWCIELLQAYFIVLDDIMDQSVLRRGEPCWYKKPDVGLCAINDALLLHCGIYKLLQKHFAGSKCYMNVLHEFLQVTHETVYGQCIDMMCNPINQKPRFDMFTFERYLTLVEYKTTNYTYRLPVHLAMHLAGGYLVKDFEFTRKLCLKLGLYFQSQDDRLDCFGKFELTGKVGNDIREGKCTWFSVKFLEEASESMKKEFLENYGVDDEDAITKVLELYRKANLLERFEEFDEKLCAEISTLIESMNDIKGALFYDLFAQIRRREK
ncbi:unnamed protein product [Larinioides sclopetarius]|uniref:Farnesyl pyrophosphate synthase n=1 Tax=Larinioides sclopetarius TaxID=280406 RepID=A0AAV2AVE6_9ARAC